MVMVMETPSPQTVGLQFVRQYYTIMNQAPEHLHRFYNNQSSFVHGGIDRPGKSAAQVYGQQDIHKKILELGFRDCHAKIHLVDSQATLGDGVVVQVTGELSNNGEPMRRFMQTFVLALQQPKKYYVHNDILRYQDEIFTDDDGNDAQEGPAENEVDDEPVDALDVPNNAQEQHYYNPHPINNGIPHIDESPAMAAAAVPLNAHAPLPPSVSAPVPSVPLVVASVPAVVPPSPPEPQRSLSPEPEKPDYSSQGEDDYQEKTPSKSPEASDDQMSEPAQDEPKTYATMLSKNASTPAFGNPPGNATNSTAAMGSRKASTPSPLRSELKNDTGFVPPQPQRPPRPKGNIHMQRGGGMSGGGGGSTGNGSGGAMGYSPMQRDRMMNRGPPEDLGDTERRRSTLQYPDSQQLFVGNLPHEVDENALRGLFSDFGNVVDVRINSKPMAKPGGGKVPNFGFIVFDEPESVQSVLRKKPIYLAEHRLNVEEKIKKRMNNNDMRPGSGRQSYGRGGSMMGGRGGSNRGIGGMNRGGRGGGGPYNSNNRR